MKKIAVLLLLSTGITGHAQQVLTLTDAVNTALQNSYDIQLAKNNLEISSVNNYVGIAGGLPVVTSNANDNEQVTSINQKFQDGIRDNKRNNVSSNNLSVGVTGSILLYNGLRVMATRKRLEALQQQNQQVLDAQIQNTMAAVMTKYYDVVRQQNYLKTILQSIDVSRKRLEILGVRKEVGLSNQADLYQAQLDLNALIQSQQSQELVIIQAKTDLLNLIFLKPDTEILIADTIIIDQTVRFEKVKENLSKNPLLAAADKQIQINELIEKETASLRYPTVRASTGYNLTSISSAAGFSLLNQSYGPFLGVNISIPIYNGNISKRQGKIASINTRNAIIQRDNLRLGYESGMVRTYAAYSNALNQLKTELQNYSLAMELLNLVLQKFQLGQATIIDVKLAQQSFENEGYRLVNLTYSAKVAEIELKRLSSQLTL